MDAAKRAALEALKTDILKYRDDVIVHIPKDGDARLGVDESEYQKLYERDYMQNLLGWLDEGDQQVNVIQTLLLWADQDDVNKLVSYIFTDRTLMPLLMKNELNSDATWALLRYLHTNLPDVHRCINCMDQVQLQSNLQLPHVVNVDEETYAIDLKLNFNVVLPLFDVVFLRSTDFGMCKTAVQTITTIATDIMETDFEEVEMETALARIRDVDESFGDEPEDDHMAGSVGHAGG